MTEVDYDLTSVIEGCKKGKQKEQQRLYQLFYGKMLAICMRYSNNNDQAKDILQDAFIKIFGNIGKYSGQGSFEGWIRRIVVNTAIDFFRKSKKDWLLLGENESIEDYSLDVEDEIDDTELLHQPQQVIEAIQQLSPAYRTIFGLYVIEDFTHKEIATQLGISEGTSKSNLAKAKANLRRILESNRRRT